jgi:stage II sporulation protein AA (anti-sigma F factor antagonist)
VNPIPGLEFNTQAAAVVARMSGEIDLSNADELRRRVLEAVPNDAKGLVVDLSAVTFLDSAGIALLLDIAERLSYRLQRLRIVVPPTSLLRPVLNIVGLDQIVPLDDRMEHALLQIQTETGDD